MRFKQIKFSRIYKKLHRPIFTTIRSRSAVAKLKPHLKQIFDIIIYNPLNKNWFHFCYARLREIKLLKIKQINPFILGADVDEFYLRPEKFCDVLSVFWKHRPPTPESIVWILTLEKVSDEEIARLQERQMLFAEKFMERIKAGRRVV